MTYCLKNIFKIILFILFSSSFLYSSQTQLKIGFVIPRTTSDIFYNLVADFLQEAANDLDVELSIIEPDIKYAGMELKVEESLKMGNKTDALISVSDKDSGKRILEICERMKIPLMIENTSILDDKTKQPRKIYKSFIAEMLPNEEKAGYLLAKYLIKISPVSKDGYKYMVGIAGSSISSAAIGREKGLFRALKESPNVRLNELVRANWSVLEAEQKFGELKNKYPNTTIIWTASDSMAISAALAAKDLELNIGEDIVIGGVDWSKDGIEAVQNGLIQATAGGHFIEPIWALIATYDYLKGIDFASSEGINIKTDMKLITKDNIDNLKILFNKEKLSNIDFKIFSKFHNKNLKKYNFDIDNILKQLKNNSNTK